jgi:hypothetical protein
MRAEIFMALMNDAEEDVERYQSIMQISDPTDKIEVEAKFMNYLEEEILYNDKVTQVYSEIHFESSNIIYEIAIEIKGKQERIIN